MELKLHNGMLYALFYPDDQVGLVIAEAETDMMRKFKGRLCN